MKFIEWLKTKRPETYKTLAIAYANYVTPEEEE